jgi:hypothetical protein
LFDESPRQFKGRVLIETRQSRKKGASDFLSADRWASEIAALKAVS